MTVAETRDPRTPAEGAAGLFRAADCAELDYAVMRRSPALEPPDGSDGGAAELTILVAPEHIHAFERLVLGRGLAPRRSSSGPVFSADGIPGWASAQRVHLTSELAYGRRHRWLKTGASEEHVLRRARRMDGVRVASPADELVDTVLHCVLNLARFPEPLRARVRELVDRLRADPPLSGRAAERVQQELAPAVTWGDLLEHVIHDRWDELADRRPALLRRLAARAPGASAWRLATAFVARVRSR